MSGALMPDLDLARRFLTLLDEDAEKFTFQIFDDRKAERVNPCHQYGDLDGLEAWLTEQNRKGAGIFVTINETDGQGREALNRAYPFVTDTEQEAPLASQIRGEIGGTGRLLAPETGATPHFRPEKWHLFLLYVLTG